MIITQSLLGFKQKRTSVLQNRNSLLKLLLIINLPNVIILYLVNSLITQPYMDEQFHYDQFYHFSQSNYAYWNQKLTTPPGFYLIQSILTIPFQPTLSIARIINSLLFSNILAIFTIKIYEFQDGNQNNLSRTLALILTPSIYFFNFLDYTDTASLTFITMAYYYNIIKSEYRLFFCSVCAIFTRQNNILWVCYLMAHRILTENAKSFDVRRTLVGYVWNFIKIFLTNKMYILKQLKLQILSIVIFIVYIIKYNDSRLVFGDHTNHVATFHPTQILYLSLFIFLNAPISLSDYTTSLFNTLQSMYYSRHSLASYMFLLSICIIVVDHWTMVHPFILADNRHYIFYIYRYFFNKNIFKYGLCLVYPICIIFMVKTVVSSNYKMALLILWFIVSLLYLSVSCLVELRYFAVPFLMYCLQIRNRNIDMDVERIHRSEGIVNKYDRMIWTNIIKGVSNAVIFLIFLFWTFNDGKSRFMW